MNMMNTRHKCEIVANKYQTKCGIDSHEWTHQNKFNWVTEILWNYLQDLRVMIIDVIKFECFSIIN